MTLFLNQRRSIFNETGAPIPELPAQVMAEVTFAPEDAFGALGAQVRTTVPLGTSIRTHWNMNEGITWFDGEVIEPISISLAEKGLDFAFQGNVLTLRFTATSIEEVQGIGEWVVLLLPPFPTMQLRVFVWIKMFLFDMGGNQYNFGVRSSAPGAFNVSTTESASARIEQGLRDALEIQENELRIVSAMHYYRHALWLFEFDQSRQSMVAEVILNLTKAIEIIASNDRDKIREVAAALGYNSDEIEKHIIRLSVIRNKLDVAHVATGPMSESERAIVQDFATSAFAVVREFIERVLAGVRAGTVTLKPISSKLDTEKRKLLEDIANYS